MKRIRLLVLSIVFVTFAWNAVAAHQSASSNTTAAEAGAAYDARDWPKAARLYAELSQSPDAPPRVWLRLRVSLREIGQNTRPRWRPLKERIRPAPRFLASMVRLPSIPQ
jgi:hypothetical protein